GGGWLNLTIPACGKNLILCLDSGNIRLRYF
ncbi:unnamed protein product, partial [marine sediment metagenome]